MVERITLIHQTCWKPTYFVALGDKAVHAANFLLLHSRMGQRSVRRKVRLRADGWWAVSDRVIWEYL